MLPTAEPYTLLLSEEMDDEFYQLLKDKLRRYNRRAAPWMEEPEAIPLNIRVVDEQGRLIGGLAALTYWGWLVIKLLVLDDEGRGNGLGQRLIGLAHQEAEQRGCTRAQTTTYDFQALAFYQRQGYAIVGTIEDYPTGYDYYWLRKELTLEAHGASVDGGVASSLPESSSSVAPGNTG